MDDRTDQLLTFTDGTPTFWGRDGAPMTAGQYVAARHDHDVRLVARTTVGDATVTTVWLGIDQGNRFDGGPPLIFGTIIRRGDRFDEHSERFSATEADAFAVHQETVASLPGAVVTRGPAAAS